MQKPSNGWYMNNFVFKISPHQYAEFLKKMDNRLLILFRPFQPSYLFQRLEVNVQCLVVIYFFVIQVIDTLHLKKKKSME